MNGCQVCAPSCFCAVLNFCCDWIPQKYRTVTFIEVEKDQFCREVIKARLAEGHFGKKPIPVFEDVLKFSMKDLPDARGVDGLMGGFPCQATFWCLCLWWCFPCLFNPVRDVPKQERRQAYRMREAACCDASSSCGTKPHGCDLL